MTNPRNRPRDIQHRRDINAFGALLDEVMRDAAIHYPVGGAPEDIFQWARVTSKLIFEMVKRKGNSPEFIMKRAQREVRRWQERAKADELLGLKAPKLEPPQKEDPSCPKHTDQPILSPLSMDDSLPKNQQTEAAQTTTVEREKSNSTPIG